VGPTRAQGRHAGLTRQQVLHAAVQMVDRDGAAALSMRKLARELDVEAMTLYHHVKNKQGLEDAIVQYVMDEAFTGAETDAPWRTVLEGYGRAFHRGLLAHPGAVPFFASRPAITPGNVVHLEKMLRVLRDAGFAPQDALLVIQTLAAVVLGQHSAPPADDGDPGIDTEALAEFPLFVEAMGSGAPSVESRVEFALQAFIAGLKEPSGAAI
jgi:TetR/AcrR family tetracycline transcriptional repressor